MNQERLAKLKELYPLALAEAHTKYPDHYRWPAEDVPRVAAKMLKTVEERGDFGLTNVDSKGFQILCKKLGIKHTKKALTAFLNGD